MTHLTPGDPAPWFSAPASNNPNFAFSTVAGRFVVLSFFGSVGEPAGGRFLQLVSERARIFDDSNMTFFGVSRDPGDARRVPLFAIGVRYFWDQDGTIAKLYGLRDDAPLTTLILDLTLRVLGVLTDPDPEKHATILFNVLERLPKLPPPTPAGATGPILVVPRVFEPGLCRRLIELYRTNGGEDSGFMREKDGKTVGVIDYNHKRRSDYTDRGRIDTDGDAGTDQAAGSHRRSLKAFQFKVTRMERYIVACYDASEGGYFRPHRDNTTKGTAHRRFAVTLNLNSGGIRRRRPAVPGVRRAASSRRRPAAPWCSPARLLHEATPVTRGIRYAFLPFLYDDAAAARSASPTTPISTRRSAPIRASSGATKFIGLVDRTRR